MEESVRCGGRATEQIDTFIVSQGKTSLPRGSKVTKMTV